MIDHKEMESSTQDLILRTLPENLQEAGSWLIATAKASEEERLKGRQHRYGRRNGSTQRDGSDMKVESEEIIIKRMNKAERAGIPIAIARLIMELWSHKMRQHAEKLVLQKAVEEQYLKENLLKWVYVLETDEKKSEDDWDWFIENQDDAIIELVWNRFNMKEHFHEVNNHRMWIQRSYDRLKDFFPNLSSEIIERHDLSKFAFSQAIGYTLKWVHDIYHEMWRTARDLHLHNEPHHPQAWSNLYTPEEKRRKLDLWLRDVCDFRKGCPYGVDITNLDLEPEDLAEPFLLESFIDMVACEWERKKGQRLDITTWELVNIEDKFLNRYSKKQHQIISSLIKKIIASGNQV